MAYTKLKASESSNSEVLILPDARSVAVFTDDATPDPLYPMTLHASGSPLLPKYTVAAETVLTPAPKTACPSCSFLTELPPSISGDTSIDPSLVSSNRSSVSDRILKDLCPGASSIASSKVSITSVSSGIRTSSDDLSDSIISLSSFMSRS